MGTPRGCWALQLGTVCVLRGQDLDWRGLGSDPQEAEGTRAVRPERSFRGSRGFHDLPPSEEQDIEV